MTAAAKQLAKQALALPEKERAKLAGLLVDSLPGQKEALSEKDWEEAWLAEVNQRATEIESGTVKCVPYSEVRKRMSKILRRA